MACGLRMVAVLLLLRAGEQLDGVEILGLEVPGVVLNASEQAVVLDCDYQFSRQEKADLVVRWYFNSSPFPFYQWIPYQPPQALGEFIGKLDLSFNISRQPYYRQRAVRILHPTTELSGEYRCLVSSHLKEDSATKRMTIYSPASSLNMSVERASSVIGVNVSCLTEGAFPTPTLTLYRAPPPDDVPQGRVPLTDVKVETVRGPEGGYTVWAWSEAADSSLSSETLFECEMKIPHTAYRLTESIVYFPAALASKAKQLLGWPTSLLAFLPLSLR